MAIHTLTYRTAGAWGAGQGSNLTAPQVDLNFFEVFSAISDLEDLQTTTISIDYISQTADQLFIHLTNHEVLGPFVLPTAQWNPRGQWQPDTAYAPFDVVSFNGDLYLVTTTVTSAATFSPNTTDGVGQAIYVLILSSPENSLPLNGEVGQRLVRQAGSPLATAWVSEKIRMYSFIEQQPNSGEVLIQYGVVDFMTLPAGLAGSALLQTTPPAADTIYTMLVNGSVIGTITFTGPSPADIVVSLSADVDLVPEDIFQLVAPSIIDTQQAGVSFTIVALLSA